MEDNHYLELLQFLKGQLNKDDQYQKWANQFNERNNHIYREDRRVIPRSQVNWIISMFHDDPTMAHQEANTVYQRISQRYLWESMRRDIQDYVKTCYQCQQRGSLKQNN